MKVKKSKSKNKIKNKTANSAKASYSPPEKKEKIPMRSFADFFTLFYSNMPKMLLCNLLFAVPFGIIFTSMYFLLSKAEQFGIYLLIISVSVILIYLLYMGVNSVTVKLASGEKNFSVAKAFIKGIAEHTARHIIHSLVIFIFALIAVFSFTFYRALAQEAAIYTVFYIFYAVFVYIMLFIALHIPLLTIKFKTSILETYKTSFVMISLNAANNLLLSSFITFLSIIFFLFISMTLGVWYLTLIMAAMLLLIFPAFISLMTNFFLYDRVNAYLNPEEKKATDTERHNRISGKGYVPSSYPVANQNSSESEYVFYNGKMIKKEQLQKELDALNNITE